MSLLTDLIRLVPPSLRPNYCPTPNTYQQLANDIIGGTRATLLLVEGSFVFNYGSTTPSEDNRVFPWFNTIYRRWYDFGEGYWLSPYLTSAGPNGFRTLWVGNVDGTPGGLWAIDEGDGIDPAIDIPTNKTGSFWAVDAAYEGRTPVGPGNVPGSSPNIAITVGSTLGEARHLLLSTEGAAVAHSHLFGITVPGNDDAYFRHLAAPVAADPYTGYFITGDGANDLQPETTADLETLANTVTAPVAHDNIQPSIGTWFIKRTARAYFRLPP